MSVNDRFTIKDILDLAINTHFGNVSLTEAERDNYSRYLIMAIKELYYALAPISQWALFYKECVFDENPYDTQKLKIFSVKKVRTFLGKSHSTKTRDIVDLSPISRSLMSNYLYSMPPNKRVYCLNDQSSITIYNSINETTAQSLDEEKQRKISIEYVPYPFDVTNESQEDSRKSEPEAAIEKQWVAENEYFPLPDKYINLVFNGLMVYAYRAMPSLQATTKETLAFKLWEEGKEQAMKAEALRSQLQQYSENHPDGWSF